MTFLAIDKISGSDELDVGSRRGIGMLASRILSLAALRRAVARPDPFRSVLLTDCPAEAAGPTRFLRTMPGFAVELGLLVGRAKSIDPSSLRSSG